MKKASITPFCALCLMMVASVLFALLESARVYGLEYYASLKAEAGMDSLCAEYQPLLWEQYGVLALDGAYGTECFTEDYMSERLTELICMQVEKEKISVQNGIDLLGMSLEKLELKGYALATDQQGKLFFKYIAERMKEELPIGVAESIYKRYLEKDNIGPGDFEQEIREASDTLQRAKASKWRQIESRVDEAETEEEKELAWSEVWVFNSTPIKMLEELLGTALGIESKGVLTMILGDGAQLSVKESKLMTSMAERKRKEGNIRYTEETNWYDRVLVLEYLDTYFSCHGEVKDGHYLEYEMEYILAGKEQEWKNLEVAFEKLLFAREVANITYLLKNSEKMQQAENVARAIVLLIGENPAAVKVVQAGVVAAWAYAESVADVRTLVSGEKVSFIKKDEEWTLGLSSVFSVFQLDTKAKNCENGMAYKEYLKLLLFTEREETIVYRMLEAMEMSLQEVSDYKNCKMEQMFLAMQYRFHFQSKPLFFSLMTIGNFGEEEFHFWKEELRSYVP